MVFSRSEAVHLISYKGKLTHHLGVGDRVTHTMKWNEMFIRTVGSAASAAGEATDSSSLEGDSY